MKHANNMREKVARDDNAEASAKKAAEEKRGTAHLGNKNDSIVIGKGVANAGVGGDRMVRPVERMAPCESSKEDIAPENSAEGSGAGQKKVGGNKSTWIKGSSESKKMGGSHNVKAKL
jgi:hypothetical protein